MAETKDQTYYDQTVEKLIERFKLMVRNCLEIVGKDIDQDLKDDKLLNALKGQRQAAEDARWAAKEIDRLEAELRGEDYEDKNKTVKPKRFAEQFAK